MLSEGNIEVVIPSKRGHDSRGDVILWEFLGDRCFCGVMFILCLTDVESCNSVFFSVFFFGLDGGVIEWKDAATLSAPFVSLDLLFVSEFVSNYGVDDSVLVK